MDGDFTLDTKWITSPRGGVEIQMLPINMQNFNSTLIRFLYTTGHGASHAVKVIYFAPLQIGLKMMWFSLVEITCIDFFQLIKTILETSGEKFPSIYINKETRTQMWRRETLLNMY